jgi:nitroreductase
VVAADTRFRHNDEPNRWAQYDSGAAAMSLCVQATTLGLMAHQMGGFDAARAAAVFAIPERCTPMAMFTVGWQLTLADIPQDMRERELAPRQRRPLGDLFFASTWGNRLA